MYQRMNDDDLAFEPEPLDMDTLLQLQLAWKPLQMLNIRSLPILNGKKNQFFIEFLCESEN